MIRYNIMTNNQSISNCIGYSIRGYPAQICSKYEVIVEEHKGDHAMYHYYNQHLEHWRKVTNENRRRT